GGLGKIVAEGIELEQLARRVSLDTVLDQLARRTVLGLHGRKLGQEGVVGRAVAKLVGIGNVHSRSQGSDAAAWIDRHEITSRVVHGKRADITARRSLLDRKVQGP